MIPVVLRDERRAKFTKRVSLPGVLMLASRLARAFFCGFYIHGVSVMFVASRTDILGTCNFCFSHCYKLATKCAHSDECENGICKWDINLHFRRLLDVRMYNFAFCASVAPDSVTSALLVGSLSPSAPVF